MKITKKLLTLFLTAAMVLCAVPVDSQAATSGNYPDGGYGAAVSSVKNENPDGAVPEGSVGAAGASGTEDYVWNEEKDTFVSVGAEGPEEPQTGDHPARITGVTTHKNSFADDCKFSFNVTITGENFGQYDLFIKDRVTALNLVLCTDQSFPEGAAATVPLDPVDPDKVLWDSKTTFRVSDLDLSEVLKGQNFPNGSYVYYRTDVTYKDEEDEEQTKAGTVSTWESDRLQTPYRADTLNFKPDDDHGLDLPSSSSDAPYGGEFVFSGEETVPEGLITSDYIYGEIWLTAEWSPGSTFDPENSHSMEWLNYPKWSSYSSSDRRYMFWKDKENRLVRFSGRFNVSVPELEAAGLTNKSTFTIRVTQSWYGGKEIKDEVINSLKVVRSDTDTYYTVGVDDNIPGFLNSHHINSISVTSPSGPTKQGDGTYKVSWTYKVHKDAEPDGHTEDDTEEHNWIESWSNSVGVRAYTGRKDVYTGSLCPSLGMIHGLGGGYVNKGSSSGWNTENDTWTMEDSVTLEEGESVSLVAYRATSVTLHTQDKSGTLSHTPIWTRTFTAGSCAHDHTFHDFNSSDQWLKCADCGTIIEGTTLSHNLLWHYDNEEHWQTCGYEYADKTTCAYRTDRKPHDFTKGSVKGQCECGLKNLAYAELDGLKADGATYTYDEAAAIAPKGFVMYDSKDTYKPYDCKVFIERIEDDKDYENDKWRLTFCPNENPTDTYHGTPDKNTVIGKKIVEVKKTSKVPTPDINDSGYTELTHGEEGEYTREEVEQVGLNGLGEGDYTWEITEETGQDGQEYWVKTFKPIPRKSKGEEKVLKLKKKDISEVDLTTAELTGLKEEGAEYDENEVQQIGVKGLTKGQDYTGEISSETDEGGTKWWVVDFKPKVSRVKGWRKLKVRMSSSENETDLNTVPFTHFRGESYEYSRPEVENIGLKDLTEGEDYTAEISTESEGGTDLWVKTFNPVNGRTKNKRVLKLKKSTVPTETDLNDVDLTGLKGADDTYTGEEVGKIGLKGLVEGEDYTTEISTEEGEGGWTYWVKTFKPVTGRTTGTRKIRVKWKKSGGDEPGPGPEPGGSKVWNLYEDGSRHEYEITGVKATKAAENINKTSAKFFKATLSGNVMSVELLSTADRKKAAKGDTFEFDLGEEGTLTYVLPVTYAKPVLRLSETKGTVKKGTSQSLSANVMCQTESGGYEPLDLTDASVTGDNSQIEVEKAEGKEGWIWIRTDGKGTTNITVKKPGWNDNDPVKLKYTVAEGKSGEDVLLADLAGQKQVVLNTNAPEQVQSFPLTLNGVPADGTMVGIEADKKKSEDLGSIGDGTVNISIGRSGLGKGTYFLNLMQKNGNAKCKIKVKVSDKSPDSAVGIKIKQKYDVTTKTPMTLIPQLKEIGGEITGVSEVKVTPESGGSDVKVDAALEGGNICVDLAKLSYLSADNLKVGDISVKLEVKGIGSDVTVRLKKVTAKKTTPVVKAGKVVIPADADTSGKTVIAEANILSTWKDGLKNIRTVDPVSISLEGKNVIAERDPDDKTNSRILIKGFTEGKVSGSVKATLTYPGGVKKTVTIKVSKAKAKK